MPKIKLTKTSIADLTANEKTMDYFDTDVKGLILRVFPSGTKVFSIIYRNNEKKQKRYTIGKYPAIQLMQAKKEAQRLLLLISQGQDIQSSKTVSRHIERVEAFKFKNYIDDFYLDWCSQNLKDFRNISLILLNTCQPLHEIPLKELTQIEINRFLLSYQKTNAISNARVNKILNTLKGAISRAHEYGYINTNLLQGVKNTQRFAK